MTLALAAGAGLLATYALMLIGLAVAAPGGASLRDALRLLGDLLGLVRGLAADEHVPRRARFALWGLLAYLALPFDLVPDVIPVVGFADDVIAVGVVLRYVVRTAGATTVRRHWPGDDDGLRVLAALTSLELTEGATPRRTARRAP